jgi:hypothetical protein
MTPEEINRAIAETCGWKWYRIPQKPIHGPRVYRCLFLPAVHEIDQSPEWLIRADGTESICNWHFLQKEGGVKDYHSDLNAMAEAERVLTYEQKKQYRWKLQEGFLPETPSGQELLCHATSAQRAEAFLRTIGKWTDAPTPTIRPTPENTLQKNL